MQTEQAQNAQSTKSMQQINFPKHIKTIYRGEKKKRNITTHQPRLKESITISLINVWKRQMAITEIYQ